MRIKQRKIFREEVRKTFFLYALIPSIVISFLVYNLIFIFIKIEVKKENKRVNNLISQMLDKEFTDYKEQIEYLAVSLDLEKQSATEIYENFYNVLNKHTIKSIFYVYDKDGNIIYTNSTTGAVPQYSRKGEQSIRGLFKRMKDAPDEIVSMPNKEQLGVNKTTVYSIGKVYTDSNEKITGFIVFDILESDISKIILDTSIETIIISDKYNKNIVSTNNKFVNSLGKVRFDKNNNTYFVYEKNIFNNNVHIYTVSRIAAFNNFYVLGLGYILLIFFITSICMYVIARRISVQKTKSIDKLLSAIKEVQKGNLNTVVDIDTNDEFEILGKYYNKMIEKLDNLIKKNKEIARRSSLSELKQLQAQINPHFLYNTLDIIKWSAKFGKDDDVVLMTTNLAKLLRYSTNNPGEFVFLKDDISMIESYLIIQKMRWNEKLHYTVEIEEDLPEIKIPKLLIQPVVENIFKHALSNVTEDIKIYIIARKFNENFEIEISDNGMGIKEDKLLEINKNLKEDDNLNDSVGLFNVHKRLNLYYGSKYGLEIRSTYLKGTVVKMTIPCKYEV